MLLFLLFLLILTHVTFPYVSGNILLKYHILMRQSFNIWKVQLEKLSSKVNFHWILLVTKDYCCPGTILFPFKHPRFNLGAEVHILPLCSTLNFRVEMSMLILSFAFQATLLLYYILFIVFCPGLRSLNLSLNHCQRFPLVWGKLKI